MATLRENSGFIRTLAQVAMEYVRDVKSRAEVLQEGDLELRFYRATKERILRPELSILKRHAQTVEVVAEALIKATDSSFNNVRYTLEGHDLDMLSPFMEEARQRLNASGDWIGPNPPEFMKDSLLRHPQHRTN